MDIFLQDSEANMDRDSNSNSDSDSYHKDVVSVDMEIIGRVTSCSGMFVCSTCCTFTFHKY